MTDMSRMPERAMFRVRGMGVAERVSTSAVLHSCFSFSFWATPNRCSSSMMTSPRSWKRTSLETSRWVPTMMSMLPRFTFRRISSCCLGVRNRESSSTSTGKPSIRRRMVW